MLDTVCSFKPMPSTGGETVPSVFCWTKMGTEAGQSLEDIVRRKDLERQCGSGTFAWGIGNSVGSAVRHARSTNRTTELETLFTPMKSAAKPIDVAPAQIVMWLGYHQGEGIVPLPLHMLITSRGQVGSGAEKRGHYALFCQTEQSLLGRRNQGAIDRRAVCNLVSSNPVGASQVTSVVRHDRRRSSDPTYPVLFRAHLIGAGAVRLAVPVVVDSTFAHLYQDVCNSRTAEEWQVRIALLKARTFAYWSTSVQTALFAESD